MVEPAVEVELEPHRVLKVCTAEDLIVLKLISTRAVDYYDLETIIRFQKDVLDEKYIIGWLKQFEAALDDSALIDAHRKIRASK